MEKTVLTLGHGYTANVLANRLRPEGWRFAGTYRDADKATTLQDQGVTPILWTTSALQKAVAQAEFILISAGPGQDGDPTLQILPPDFWANARHLKWVGYLSTTGVYGDHNGAWVDEDTPLIPTTKRGQARLTAERAWQAIPDLPLHIFRLAGIYGPGRGPFAKVRNGTARRIIKPGQVFSRVHVDDIAQALEASMRAPSPGSVYNLCDDDPAPPQDVLSLAAKLLDLPEPPAIPFDQADLGPMARSFYAENKKVSNARMKCELGVDLLYPSYTSGLPALLDK